MTSSLGLVSSRYRLGELLGTGGSASVFAAVDESSGERVALKLLHPHLSQRPSARDAFLDEARRVQRLRHPNIAGVLGVGVDEATAEPVAWIALERAEGLSLAEHVERYGPLGVVDALTAADGVLRALEAAHAEGLIHRDVSPANVMIAFGGNRDGDGGGTGGGVGLLNVGGVRLLDFGLADAAGRAALGGDILRTEGAGERVGVIGNVGYMSPEQLRGESVDERGDLYQVGGLLHYALTGSPPYVRATVRETMRAHLEAPPPVASVLDSRIPRDVDRAIVRALLKHPQDRHASATGMRTAIVAAARAAAAADAPGGADSTRVLGRTRVPGGTGVDVGAVRADAVTTAVLARAGDSRGGRGAGSARISSSARVPGPADPNPPRPVRLGAWISGLLAVAAAAAIVAFAAASAPPAAVSTQSQAPTVAPVADPPPSEAPAPVIVHVGVPELAMMSLADARRTLVDEGLEVGALSVVDSVYRGDTVLSSSPGAGERVEAGRPVDLVVASGANVVPGVVGASRANAVAALQAAGFTVTVVTRRSTSAGPGTVIGVEPASGAVLRLGSTVTVMEVEALPAPSPTVAPTPTPAPTPVPTPPPTSGPEIR